MNTLPNRNVAPKTQPGIGGATVANIIDAVPVQNKTSVAILAAFGLFAFHLSITS